MTDHILSIALVFTLLTGGTVAIGSELIGAHGRLPAQAAVATATLPMVVVTGKRLATTVVASGSVAASSQHLQ